MAADELHQSSEAHTAPAEVEASDVFQVLRYIKATVGFSVTLEFPHNSSIDTLKAAVAETEESVDCEQCLQEETQRAEELESRLQMLGLSGSDVLEC